MKPNKLTPIRSEIFLIRIFLIFQCSNPKGTGLGEKNKHFFKMYFPIFNKMVSNKNWAYSKNISMNWSLETYFGHFFSSKSPLWFFSFEKSEKSKSTIPFWYMWPLSLWILFFKKSPTPKSYSPVFFTPLFSSMTVVLLFPCILYIYFHQLENSWPPVKICCYFFSTASVMSYDWWTFTKFTN